MAENEGAMAGNGNDSKNVTGAGLKAALEAVRAKVPTAGETQRRFEAVTTENFSEIRVGDVVKLNSVEYVVTYKSSTKMYAQGGNTTPSISQINPSYEFTLSDGDVSCKILGAARLFPAGAGFPKVFLTRKDMSTYSASAMDRFLPPGTCKCTAASPGPEMTVMSCTADGKKLQVLNGPKLERVTLDESGEEPKVNYEVYPLRREWTQEEIAGLQVSPIATDGPVKPGDYVKRGDNGARDLVAGCWSARVFSLLRLDNTPCWGLYARVESSGSYSGNPPDFGRITRLDFGNSFDLSALIPGDTVSVASKKHTVVGATDDYILMAGPDGIQREWTKNSEGNYIGRILRTFADYSQVSGEYLYNLDTQRPWGTLDGSGSDCGMVFGTHDEEDGLHADTIVGNVVTSYLMQQNSTQGVKVKEYEIPEKGKLEEIMAMLEKDLPHRYDMDDEADIDKMLERIQSFSTAETMKDYLLKAGDVYYNARGEDGEIIGLGEGMAVSHDVMGLPIVMILGKLYRFSPMQEAENRWISWAILTGAEATAYPAPSSEPEAGEEPGEG